jgi:hypothetical protein
MFEKSYEDRLRAWAEFRDLLKNQDDPIQTTIDFYNRAPLVNIQVDPYEQDSWLNPWELLKENQYCDFSLLLGIAYTLQLSGVFSQEDFEIHICTDKQRSEVKYLLYVKDKVIGYNRAHAINADELPSTISTEIKYTLKNIQ